MDNYSQARLRNCFKVADYRYHLNATSFFDTSPGVVYKQSWKNILTIVKAIGIFKTIWLWNFEREVWNNGRNR